MSYRTQTWVAFEGHVGVRIYALAPFVSVDALEPDAKYIAILMGHRYDYKNDGRHFVMLVKEGLTGAERVGSVDVLSSLGEGFEYSGQYAFRETAILQFDGKVHATACFDVREVRWTTRTIRLG